MNSKTPSHPKLVFPYIFMTSEIKLSAYQKYGVIGCSTISKIEKEEGKKMVVLDIDNSVQVAIFKS